MSGGYTMGPGILLPQYGHLRVAPKTHTVGRRPVRIPLECFPVIDIK